MEQFDCKNREAIIEKFKLATPIFQALGDVNRQEIIMILLENSNLNVNQLAEKVSISRPAVSHHLKILKQAGLITANKSGKETFYSLSSTEFLKHVKDLIVNIEGGY
ncbi:MULTISPECIES: metalloregulator ArsR/SmtB family transcription factor [Bacillales]|uniref:ArsR/SmtB family transcription factor n=1 Tax=Bacillales TaxID=1385 RepID=UPI00034991DF|nr:MULTISPECIES: metalloregulator ArsR/SmtB family transcription factor [Bacillales]KMZ40064.1 ArsR family transcriptional regulator [Bacillus sp. FJAT-27238]